jgi:hypothetical protein
MDASLPVLPQTCHRFESCVDEAVVAKADYLSNSRAINDASSTAAVCLLLR